MTDKIDNEVLANILIQAFAILVQEVGFGLGSWPKERMDKVTDEIQTVIDTNLEVRRES